MRVAWKFLARGAVGPFGGLRWPEPSASGPGAWVRPTPGEVFACRVPDLPWWLAEELWEVQLEEPLRALETQVASSAGRLVRRVEAWDDSAMLDYGIACAHRARALAVAALRAEGRTGEADGLAAAQGIVRIARLATQLAGEAKIRPAANLAGYVAESATRASQGAAAAAAIIAANAAVFARGNNAAFDLEREWQARWIAQRTGLPQP
jgi:hypothetical protein